MQEKTQMSGVSAPDISQQKLNTRHLEYHICITMSMTYAAAGRRNAGAAK